MKKKLVLNRQIIRRLTDNEMSQVGGGGGPTMFCPATPNCPVLTQQAGCRTHTCAC